MNILVIGGSRNIGYYAALRFLDAGHNVTFLLRNPSAFDSDATVKKHVESGLANLVKGDALIKSDVQNAWAASAKKAEGGVVDALIFTVGAVSSQAKFSITQGVVISPPNLVTQALLNALATLPSPHIKILTISSTGITRASKASLPLPIRALYAYLIASPHRDKLGAERLISHVAGLEWDVAEYGEVAEDVLDKEGKWKETEGLPAPGTVQNVLVVRPATLTDGECLADKAVGTQKSPYRVSEKDFKTWTVSRKDVGHLVFDAVVNRWDELRSKRINVGY
ncbi:hypothetical protein H0H87_010451 [Tephrocybe sp. NHM501043]|nr:hypothetical protein H0H87_010451 [Tephrocybe sp. NHM501043]